MRCCGPSNALSRRSDDNASDSLDGGAADDWYLAIATDRLIKPYLS